MIFSDEQRLNLMKDFFICEYIEKSKEIQGKSMANITFLNRYSAFSYMITLFEFNKFPLIIPDEKFNNIGSKLLYRGVKNSKYTKNILCDVNYHYGKGILADGLYVSTSPVIAETYTCESCQVKSSGIKENILTLKLDPSTKICEYNQIAEIKDALKSIYKDGLAEGSLESILGKIKNFKNYPEIEQKIQTLLAFLDSIESKEEKEIFLKTFLNDAGKLAIYLGFDAMATEKENKIIAVFNRGKIIVPQSEFDRFANATKSNSNETNVEQKIPQKS